MGTPPQSIFKKKDVQYTINWFKKYRTNISLGEEDLFYKGASPFQYNLESRNTSSKEVNKYPCL